MLKNINLKINKGEIHALLGPNAAGKSSLASVLMGLQRYKITSGKVLFRDKDLLSLKIWERANLGLSLIFQHPPAIKGVKLGDFLYKISKQKPEAIAKNIASTQLLNRSLNVDLSGGERKLSELIQIIALRPKLVIIDEIDSGLDIVNLKKVSNILKKALKNSSILLITHHGEMMKYLKPDKTYVIINGQIVCSGHWQKVWNIIHKFGYKRCKECLGKRLDES